MAHVKAHEVEAYLARPDSRHLIYLLYGPDTGLVSERAEIIAANSGVDLSDPFSHLKMDGDAMVAPSALVEEAHTISMFGGKRLIRFRPGSMRNPAEALKPLEAQPPEDALIVVEAGDLAKTSPLRKLAEKMGNAIALPCYQDEARALDRVIDQELSDSGLSMDREARDHLKKFLGGDRLASRGEVQKLCLYCKGKSTITRDDVDAIVGDVAASAVDDIVDAAATGDLASLETGFARFVGLGSPAFLLLSAGLRHFQMLHAMRSNHESGGGPVKSLVDRARPPIYFKRKNAVVQVLSRWDSAGLMAANNRLSDAIRDSRLNNELELPIIRSCLTAIALMARQRR